MPSDGRERLGLTLFAFCGKIIDPLVVKDPFLRGSPIFSQKAAKNIPWKNMIFKTSVKAQHEQIIWPQRAGLLFTDAGYGC